MNPVLLRIIFLVIWIGLSYFACRVSSKIARDRWSRHFIDCAYSIALEISYRVNCNFNKIQFCIDRGIDCCTNVLDNKCHPDIRQAYVEGMPRVFVYSVINEFIAQSNLDAEDISLLLRYCAINPAAKRLEDYYGVSAKIRTLSDFEEYTSGICISLIIGIFILCLVL